MEMADRIFNYQRRSKERKNTQPYDAALKLQIAKEYLGGTVTYQDLEDRHNINRSLIHKWVKRYAEAVSGNNLPRPRTKRRSRMGQKKRLPDLGSAEKILLQKELEELRLKNAALEALVDVAEAELGIDIRKKSVTKQSKG